MKGKEGFNKVYVMNLLSKCELYSINSST